MACGTCNVLYETATRSSSSLSTGQKVLLGAVIVGVPALLIAVAVSNKP